MRAIANRFGQRLAWGAFCALLVILFGIPGAGLSGQERRSFVDLLIAERYTTFLLFNRGDGTFLLEDYQLDDADGVAVGDFEGDGDMDFAILTGLFLGHGDFSFRYKQFAGEDVDLCRTSDNLFEFADMDADGLMDILLGCLDMVVIHYGTGDERLFERGTVLLSGATDNESYEGSTILAVGDMNEDGLLDLKMGQSAFQTQFFLNKGGRDYQAVSGELPEGHPLRASSGIERWIDFNDDGHLDIVTPYGFCLGDGKLGFACTRFEYPKGAWAIQFQIVDIDGDQAVDVATLNPYRSPAGGLPNVPASLTLFLGRGDGTIREVRRIDSFPYSVEVPGRKFPVVVSLLDFTTGDFNGDGTLDIALIRAEHGNCDGCIAPAVLWILDGTGGGYFAEPRVYPGPADAWRIANLGNIDRQFVRGDASDDRKLDVTDALVILLALFSGMSVNCGQALDSNDDAYLNLTDAVYLLNYLFLAGPPPPAPYPEPGIDATDPFFGYLGCSPEWWDVWKRGSGR